MRGVDRNNRANTFREIILNLAFCFDQIKAPRSEDAGDVGSERVEAHSLPRRPQRTTRIQ